MRSAIHPTGDELQGEVKAPSPPKSPITGRVASGYAHDSRNRLAVIQLSLEKQLELIKAPEPPPMEDLAALNRQAFSEIRMLGDMLEDLILYIRLGGGVAIPVEKKAVFVGPLMNRVTEQYIKLAAERGVKLKVKPSRMAIYTDHRLFRRVLCNLIDNALNHSRATKLVVGMRMHGENAMLEVADNGRGIPEAEQSRVFEEGFRGAASGGHGQSDRGLGLFIVKSLVEKLEGSIELKSRPGKGARFRVILNTFIEWQSHGINAPTSERTTLAGKTVAILEDHVETLRLYESAFASRGANVIASDNVAEWVGKVKKANVVPDLILVDFMIGRGTSDLALTMVRGVLMDAMPKRSKKGGKGAIGLPIVIVTGNPGHEKLKELAKNTPVLQKPLSQQSIETLTQVAAGKRALNAADFIN